MKPLLFVTTLLIAAALPLAAQPARDCNIDTGTPAGVQAACAIQHANFVYTGLCGSASYCSSQDQQLLSAYRNAATLFDRSHSIHANPADAFWSGFLHERAHEFPIAASTYAACMRIAAYDHNMTQRDNCASHIAVVKCAVDATANCQVASSRLITIGGGGEVASAIDADEVADVHSAHAATGGAGQAEHSNAAIIATPATADTNALEAAMTDKQRQAARDALTSEGLSMTPAANAPEGQGHHTPPQ